MKNKKNMYILLAVLAVILVAVIVVAIVLLSKNGTAAQGGETTTAATAQGATEGNTDLDVTAGTDSTEGTENDPTEGSEKQPETTEGGTEPEPSVSVGVDTEDPTEPSQGGNDGDKSEIDFDELLG